MDMNILVCMLIAIISAIIAIVATYFITKKIIKDADFTVEKAKNKVIIIDEYKGSKDFQDLLNSQYNLGKTNGTDESLVRYKETHEFKSLIEHENLKGREQGKQEALLAYKDSLEFDAIKKNEFHKGRKEGIENAHQEYKDSDEFQAIKENEYRKGHKDGEREILKSFEIRTEAWYEEDDGLFIKTYRGGYTTQIYRDNAQFGGPVIQKFEDGKKFKKENLEYLIEQLKYGVEKYIEIETMGISRILSKKPKKLIKGK